MPGMINDGMYSSTHGNWETPQKVFDTLNEIFDFTLDVCATPETSKCGLFFSTAENALEQSWEGYSCYMNPPYGKEIIQWVRKASQEQHKPNTTVVALLPNRTDTDWYQEYVTKARYLIIIRHRLRFSNSKNSAPFPSVVAVFCQKSCSLCGKCQFPGWEVTRSLLGLWDLTPDRTEERRRNNKI